MDDVNVVEQDPAEDDGDDARRSRITLAMVLLFAGKSRTMDSRKTNGRDKGDREKKPGTLTTRFSHSEGKF